MNGPDIHIIGGGIIGLCSAYYLQKEGYSVAIVDRGDLSDGTSHGNAGMIVPSHFVPMAAPGVITQGMKWLLDSKSPFYVKPRADLKLVQWLWQFYKAANPKQVAKVMPFLYEFNNMSKELYSEIAREENFEFGYEERGLLMLFKSAKQAAEEQHMADDANKLRVKAEMLDRDQLKKLEPEMELDVAGGLYFPDDAHLYPNQLMGQLVKTLKDRGVVFLTNTDVADLEYSNQKISALITSKGTKIETKKVLLCGGSWTAHLLQKVGIKMLLQDGRGYSLTLQSPQLRPRIPTILSEAKVAITPMGADLRIGGTLELSGLSTKVNKNRVAGIIESIPKYYKNLEVAPPEAKSIWQGYRPCTPDGIPYLGQSSHLSNLYIGTGHGMMGLSLGASSGKLLCEIISGQQTTIDVSLMNPDRYS